LAYKERVMQDIIETANYLKDAKRAGLTDEELEEFKDFIARNPDAGNEIAGTGGSRKVRFAAKGKGKSGGVRVITFYSGPGIPVFLLNVFAKNEKVNLTQDEKKALKTLLPRLVETYKQRRRH
jgi:hypothetical protein